MLFETVDSQPTLLSRFAAFIGHSAAGLALPTLLGVIPEAMIGRLLPSWLQIIQPIIVSIGFFVGVFTARISNSQVARWVWVTPGALIMLGIVFSPSEVRVGLIQNAPFLFIVVGPFFSGIAYAFGHALGGRKDAT